MKQPTRNSPSATISKTATPCCTKVGLKKGPWTPEEDEILSKYIKREGEGKWRMLPKKAGLLRCGKSCRLRWMNYLRPSVKRGHIGPDEEDLILRLHRLLGNRWALIAGRIPGRTDNEIKNYWNTHLSKKLISQGIDPRTHKPLNPNPTPPFPTTAPRFAKYGSRAEDGMERGKAYLELDHDWLNTNGLMVNMESNSGKEDTGLCNDDTFSSFLDSLMNQQNVCPTYENVDSSSSALGYDGAWDAGMSSSSSATFDRQDDCCRGSQ